jgi:hypothetical protein
MKSGLANDRWMAPQLEHGQTEILRPSKSKYALLLLGSAAFVAAGFFILQHIDTWPERVAGYAGIGFFGLCGMVALIVMAPGSSYLRLNSEGMTFRTFWRATFIRWSDIERFGVLEFTTPGAGIPPRHRMVGFDYLASYPRGEKSRMLAESNRRRFGFEGALPDNYGWKHADLAAHLNELRERYAWARGETAR